MSYRIGPVLLIGVDSAGAAGLADLSAIFHLVSPLELPTAKI
jgi:hypothetical protein